MNLSELSVVDLKAMIYDQIVISERAKANIQALEQQMVKKSKEVKDASTEDKAEMPVLQETS